MGLLSDLMQQVQNGKAGSNPDELVPITDIVADLDQRVMALEDTVAQLIDELNGQTVQNVQNVQGVQDAGQTSQVTAIKPPETLQQ